MNPAEEPYFLAGLSHTGADACPVDLQDKVTSIFGVPLYNIWGATEVMGSLTFGLQRGPVARFVEEARIRLVDDNGVEVADGGGRRTLDPW